MTADIAHGAGALLGRARASDVVDAVVAYATAALDADVVTGDRGEISRLLNAAGVSSRILDV